MLPLFVQMPDQMQELTGEILVHEKETQSRQAFMVSDAQNAEKDPAGARPFGPSYSMVGAETPPVWSTTRRGMPSEGLDGDYRASGCLPPATGFPVSLRLSCDEPALF
ncbi:hypothetical protein AA0535_0819 [Asaia krungthepensis NRIC 0535]|uniref:Uncharacterized protein n=1 Tax=Asaia krungthepensis NRIC 0535 TaxID=1307925 RepID=A0ABQ0PZT0_9PROT|nr:hypothetical protein AA0535_0819 [Asaia krungthepensis NRIC 0535]